MATHLRLHLLSWLVLWLVCFSTPATAQETCLKYVFNRYCLGGTLPAADIATMQLTRIGQDADATWYRSADVNAIIDISVKNNKINAVIRRDLPAGWLNYIDWRQRLTRLYNNGEDLSQFPEYASSRSSKFNAIYTQKGFAHTLWQQEGWYISLLWQDPDHIELHYILGQYKTPALTGDL